MDILNFISWLKGGRVVNTVDAAKTLLPVGLKDNRRDDGYLAGAITVEDLVTQLTPTPTYKVYTALLTQSGGDDPKSMQGDGGGDISSATKGTTVEIFSNYNNIDYSSIGAPNSNVGTYFILTQDITLSNLDIDTIFTINTGAPVAIVLENTIGNIWFTYDDTGQYGINLADTFIEEKTFILTPSFGYDSAVLQGGGGDPYSIYRFSDNKCVILTSNGSLNKTPIEIRVYN